MKKTQKNGSKHVLSGPVNRCSKNFVNLQGKHPCGGAFFKQS